MPIQEDGLLRGHLYCIIKDTSLCFTVQAGINKTIKGDVLIMANELDLNEVLNTIPPEMVEDMKKQAEKYGFTFEEYAQSVLGAIVTDPDLGAY